jgi:uncharacterized protein
VVVRIPCPTCRREVLADESKPLPEHFPFCSRRCRLLDLGKWADGEYRIPGKPAPTPSDEPSGD